MQRIIIILLIGLYFSSCEEPIKNSATEKKFSELKKKRDKDEISVSTHENQIIGFEIMIPPGWEMRENELSRLATRLQLGPYLIGQLGPKKREVGSPKLLFTLEPIDSDSVKKSDPSLALEKYYKKSFESLKQIEQSGEVKYESIVSRPYRQHGYRIEAEFTYLIGPLHSYIIEQKALLHIIDGYGFTVTATTLKSAKMFEKHLLWETLESLKITTKGNWN